MASNPVSVASFRGDHWEARRTTARDGHREQLCWHVGLRRVVSRFQENAGFVKAPQTDSPRDQHL